MTSSAFEALDAGVRRYDESSFSPAAPLRHPGVRAERRSERPLMAVNAFSQCSRYVKLKIAV
jgi:hypothetical protein